MDRTLELIQLAKEGNSDARDQIIEENLGLVWSVVRRFTNRGYEIDDLYQIGCIGLMKCIDKFDLSFEVKFSTYAVPMIAGEIKRFLRDDGILKISRSLKEMAYKIHLEYEKYVNEHGKEPTVEEIATILKVDKEEIVVALEANSEVESIYKTIYQGDGNSIYLMDKLVSNEDESSKVVEHLALSNVLQELTKQEYELIRLRYFEERTQTEIARLMQISQVQVSRLEKKILGKLRGKLS